MGYSTDFSGQFDITPPLSSAEIIELQVFNELRHEELSAPGLYCQWTCDDTGAYLGWDGREKFYEYLKWLQYLITTRFKPAGHVLNGVVHWSGEEDSDKGIITVKNNVIYVQYATAVQYGQPVQFR